MCILTKTYWLFFSFYQDQANPKTIDYNNAISQSIKNSSKIGTASDAGAVLSQVATNDIPNRFYVDKQNNDDVNINTDELTSFNLDAQRITTTTLAGHLAANKKNSLSQFFTIKSCAQSHIMYSPLPRSGWGIPFIGLKGKMIKNVFVLIFRN